MALDFHRFANLFPLIENREFEEFAHDIESEGLIEKIVLYEGEILDGRNRYRACLALDPQFGPESDPEDFSDFDGADDTAALAFVLSRNLHRRQLNESQRAFVGAKIATLKQGARTDLASIDAKSQTEAAQTMNVSRSSVQRGAEVLEFGSAELKKAVEQGIISISAAATLAHLPLAEQLIAITEGRAAVLRAAKNVNQEKRERKHQERIGRIREMSQPSPAMPDGRKWCVIYADPPWRYEDQPMGFTDRSIENHYETMTLDEICALPVPDIATPDAVLFLWITSPQMHLPVKRKIGDGEALQRGVVTVDELMVPGHVPGLIEVVDLLDPDTVLSRVLRAWGGHDPATGEETPFVYKAQYVWDKVLIGPGHWARTQHEILVAATRGSFPPPPEHARPPSLYSEQRTAHSAKPDYFADMIVKMFDLPRIELFARVRRPGWDAWGNQTPDNPSLTAPINDLAAQAKVLADEMFPQTEQP